MHAESGIEYELIAEKPTGFHKFFTGLTGNYPYLNYFIF